MATLLFDLDGTLTDPALGITACIQHAMQSLGHSAPLRDSLKRFIGPPLRNSFAELLASDDARTLDAALALYRERFGTVGLYENEVYPFVRAALAEFKSAGHRMWVATSKPSVYATRIVDHFELGAYFEGVYGSELSGERSDKSELLQHLLAAEHLDAASAWMIGDRLHDVRAGIANGTHTVGVLWGYGSKNELVDAGAEILLDTMGPLLEYVRSS